MIKTIILNLVAVITNLVQIKIYMNKLKKNTKIKINFMKQTK
jgi:hypothetical protein